MPFRLKMLGIHGVSDSLTIVFDRVGRTKNTRVEEAFVRGVRPIEIFNDHQQLRSIELDEGVLDVGPTGGSFPGWHVLTGPVATASRGGDRRSRPFRGFERGVVAIVNEYASFEKFANSSGQTPTARRVHVVRSFPGELERWHAVSPDGAMIDRTVACSESTGARGAG